MGDLWTVGGAAVLLPLVTTTAIVFATRVSWAMAGFTMVCIAVGWLASAGAPAADELPALGLPWLAVALCVLMASALRDSDVAHHLEARRDPLTGLRNRTALDEAVGELAAGRRAGRMVAVLIADIDHFKAINDRHGHLAGDDVLRAVAARMERALHTAGELYRAGGEEFVALVPDVDELRAVALAEALRSAVAGHTIDDLRVTVSVGVAARAGTSFDWDAAYADADRALYRAKSGGRNRVAIAPDAGAAASAARSAA
ncbi:MAG: GGDEF domain-containing protein [Solirubrobacterales bacterium]|nr:GGDEF domain-containing protein [Solirubrobacterales bacterium]